MHSDDTDSRKRTAKGAVTIDYSTYILDLDKAIEVMKLLHGAEKLDLHWNKEHSVSETYINKSVESHIKLMSEVEYHKAKMLGDVLKKEKL